MNKPIAIVIGDPNSISSEIIFKFWLQKKKFKHLPCLLIGNFDLLNKQLKFFKYNLKLKLIDTNFNLKELNGKEIPIINIQYKQKNVFQKISKKTNNFIFSCFSEALNLIKKKKIIGFINGPIAKETLFKNKFNGVTEYISSKVGYKNKSIAENISIKSLR